MDSYLIIAEAVLRKARQPLAPREILKRAYLECLVPTHLFGKTQHKTLQARMSEDILTRKERSAFFRTEPGMFFLREFLTDTSIPEEYRNPIVSRRRQRDLHVESMLVINLDDLRQYVNSDLSIDTRKVLAVLGAGRFKYIDKIENIDPTHILIWSFVVIKRHNFALAYRCGRYRAHKDTFFSKRTIGFRSLISQNDGGLFESDDLGIRRGGIRAAAIDLDIPRSALSYEEITHRSKISFFILSKEAGAEPDLLSVILFDCPEWFEPTKKRLAINELSWLDLTSSPNDLNDYDPYSILVWGRLRNEFKG